VHARQNIANLEAQQGVACGNLSECESESSAGSRRAAIYCLSTPDRLGVGGCVEVCDGNSVVRIEGEVKLAPGVALVDFNRTPDTGALRGSTHPLLGSSTVVGGVDARAVRLVVADLALLRGSVALGICDWLGGWWRCWSFGRLGGGRLGRRSRRLGRWRGWSLCGCLLAGCGAAVHTSRLALVATLALASCWVTNAVVGLLARGITRALGDAVFGGGGIGAGHALFRLGVACCFLDATRSFAESPCVASGGTLSAWLALLADRVALLPRCHASSIALREGVVVTGTVLLVNALWLRGAPVAVVRGAIFRAEVSEATAVLEVGVLSDLSTALG